MKVSEPPVIVVQDFEVSIPTVWNAITDINEMTQWYFGNIPDFKAEVGFTTQFNIQNEGRNFLHRWRVTEVDAPKKIVCRWSFGEYSGEADVVFELSELNGKTRVTLSNYVREDFPDDIPEFRRESCVGGWTYFINESLREYLKRGS